MKAMIDNSNEHKHEERWLGAYRELQDGERLDAAARARILTAMQERAAAAPAARRRVSFPARRWIMPAAAAAITVTLAVFWTTINGNTRSEPAAEKKAAVSLMQAETALPREDTNARDTAPAVTPEDAPAVTPQVLPEVLPEDQVEAVARLAPDLAPKATLAAAGDPTVAGRPDSEDLLDYARRQLRDTDGDEASFYSNSEMESAEIAAASEEALAASREEAGLKERLAPLQLADAGAGVAQVLLGAPGFPELQPAPADPPPVIQIEAVRAVYGDGEPLDPGALIIQVQSGATAKSAEALHFGRDIRLPALLLLDTRALGCHEEYCIELVIDGEDISLLLLSQP